MSVTFTLEVSVLKKRASVATTDVAVNIPESSELGALTRGRLQNYFLIWGDARNL